MKLKNSKYNFKKGFAQLCCAALAASHRECAIEDGHRLYMEIMDLVMYKHLYAMNAQLFSSSSEHALSSTLELSSCC